MLDLWGLICICVFLYLCICVFATLDTHNYLLWGPMLFRNHCWKILNLYIRVYMPSADCTLLSSRGGGGGAIFLKVHLPAPASLAPAQKPKQISTAPLNKYLIIFHGSYFQPSCNFLYLNRLKLGRNCSGPQLQTWTADLKLDSFCRFLRRVWT